MAHQGSNITFDNGIAVNFATGQVTRQGKELNLSPVNTRLLQILVGAKGSLVLRQQLFDEVWPNQIISDDALTRAIADIRAIFKQLTDDKVIETLPKRGYRWLITPVRTSCMDAQANESENKGTDRKLFSNSGFLDESKSSKALQRSLIVIIGVLLVLTSGFLVHSMLDRPDSRVLVLPIQNSSQTIGFHNKDISRSVYEALLTSSRIKLLPGTLIKSVEIEYLEYLVKRFDIDRFIELQISSRSGLMYDLEITLIDAQNFNILAIQSIKFRSLNELPAKLTHHLPILLELHE